MFPHTRRIRKAGKEIVLTIIFKAVTFDEVIRSNARVQARPVISLFSMC